MKKIEFEDLYTVPMPGCVGCLFKDARGCQSEAVKMITGVNCFKEGVIFKRKPKWVRCTMENTQVGDTVYMGITKYKVDLIYEDSKAVLTKVENPLAHFVIWLSDCQKEVK